MIKFREISPLPVALGVVLMLIAVILVVWLAGRPWPDRYDEEKVAHAFGRMAKDAQLGVVDDKINRLTSEIDQPKEPFERLNRMKELRDGKSAADYEAALASNRKVRTDDLTRQRAPLLEERKRLKAELDKPPPGRGIGGWISDHPIIFSVLPFTLLGFYVMRVAVAAELPKRNPLHLTDPNRRGVLLFLACFLFAITIFAVGLAFVADL